jgi:hypothetical protein
MADEVAAERERALAELGAPEEWEIRVEAETESDLPPGDALRDELVASVPDGVEVLQADVGVRDEGGRQILFVVLAFVVIGTIVASKRFTSAGKAAEVVRLRLEEFGPVIAQSIRRAA